MSEEKKEPEWEYKTQLKITKDLKEIIRLTKEASELQIAELKKKLDKINYEG